MSKTSGEPASRGQTALLTFLIADVRGYTQFTLQHGDEAAAKLAARLAQVTREVVEARDGRVLELRGDEAVATFASAQQALYASAELLRRCSQEDAADSMLPLRVGIGLDIGEAIPVEGGYRSASLNLAARLSSLAAAGESLASETVVAVAHKLQDLEYVQRGEVQLKGFADPVRVVQIVSATEGGKHDELEAESMKIVEPAEQRLPLGAFLGSLPTGMFVGRHKELERILEVVDRVSKGEGRTALLTGEPGSGKTRLGQEVTLHLRNRGFLVAAGRCYEPEQTLPYYPFLDCLEMLYAAASPSLRAQALQRWPYLGVLLPAESGPFVAGEDNQQRVFRALMGFLEALSREAPLALLLDDLHWSDSASLKLLLHLSRHVRTLPILLMGAYRDVEVRRQHPLEAALRDLHREGLSERIHVRRMDEAETAALVAATMGEDSTSTEFVSLVHGRTDGNPYFVQQVLQVLVERGDIFRHGDTWDRRAIEDIEVPESVRAVVGQRLSRLPESTQDVLREASVLGQSFLFDDLASVSELGERELEGALEEAAQVGVIQETSHDAYAFDHALTQQSIYEEISSRRRRRVHLAAAEALDQLPEARRSARVTDIARHFLEADDPERAMRYAILAGDSAEKVFAHEEAELQYRRAAQLAQEIGDDVALARALEKLGSVLEFHAQADEALEASQTAAGLYRSSGDRAGEARATARVSSALMHLGKVHEAVSRLQEMIGELESESETPELARLFLQLTAILYGSGQYDACLQTAERAAAAATTVEDAGILAQVENYRADVHLQMGRIADARLVFEKTLPIAEASGDLKVLAHTVLDLALTYLYGGRFAECLTFSRRAVELQQRIESPVMVAFAMIGLGAAHFYSGRWEEARRAIGSASDLIGSLPSSWHAPIVFAYTAIVESAEGRWAETDASLEHIFTSEHGGHVVLPFAHLTLAERELLQGDPASALTRLEPFARDHSLYVTPMLPTLALAQLETGDVSAAERTLSSVINDLAAQTPLVLTDAFRVQGMVLNRQGRHQEARGAFEQALSLARTMDYPRAEARALYEWGHVQASDGDLNEARKQFSAALSIFERLGAMPEARQTRQALGELATE
jgi:class 3 adenylate cyclase/tetratricopeptide (TPR) repeat protein